MRKKVQASSNGFAALAVTAVFCFCTASMPASGQQSAAPPAKAQTAPGAKSSSQKPETHITPEQAKELFSAVDELLKFSSQEKIGRAHV